MLVHQMVYIIRSNGFQWAISITPMHPAAFLQRTSDDCCPTLNVMKRVCVCDCLCVFLFPLFFSMQCLLNILLEVGVASNLDSSSHHFKTNIGKRRHTYHVISCPCHIVMYHANSCHTYSIIQHIPNNTNNTDYLSCITICIYIVYSSYDIDIERDRQVDRQIIQIAGQMDKWIDGSMDRWIDG